MRNFRKEEHQSGDSGLVVNLFRVTTHFISAAKCLCKEKTEILLYYSMLNIIDTVVARSDVWEAYLYSICV